MYDLNKHNQRYYLRKGTTKVPDILAVAGPIQEAIRLTIESVILTDPINVLELGFGSRPDRYIHMARHTARKWRVTLSDFSIDVLPANHEFEGIVNISIDYLALNLLSDPFPLKKYDVILSTYTFDSIDFKEDKFENGQHYPGGLINIANKAIGHLNSPGLFLTIDKWATRGAPINQDADAAKFKSLNLEAAAKELESSKLCKKVSLVSLNELLINQQQQFPINLSDHGCLAIYC